MTLSLLLLVISLLLNFYLGSRYPEHKTASAQIRYLSLIVACLGSVALVYLVSVNVTYLVLLPLAITSYAITIIDLVSKRIPNQINLALAVTTAGLIGVGSTTQLQLSVDSGLAAGTTIFLFLLAINLFAAGSIGMGDVKFAWPWGVSIGFFGATTAYLAIMLSFILAAGIAIFLLIRGGTGIKSQFPFGPVMVISGWLALVISASFTASNIDVLGPFFSLL